MTTSLQRHLLLKLSKGTTLREKGFTLIELLVVIVIIGILSAIALPSFLSQRAKAYDAEGKSIAGSVYRGLQACMAENPTSTCTGSYLNDTYGVKTLGYANHSVAVNNTAATPNVVVTPTGAALTAAAQTVTANSSGITLASSSSSTSSSSTSSSSASSTQ